jgi:hypothetical protein
VWVEGLTVLSTRVPHSAATVLTRPHSEACTPWFRNTISTTCFTECPSTVCTLSSLSPSCRSIVAACAFVALGVGCRVQGAGFRVQGSGFRVQGSGCRVQGVG